MFYKQIPSKIDIPTTIIGLLKGEHDVWLQNQTFVVADKDSKFLKELFKPSIIHGKQDALQIKAPTLYIKNEYGQFTKQYRIELTSKIKNKETYRFSRPNDMCYPNKTAKRKNVIRTKIIDRDAEILAMIKLDNIVYMGLEYLLLAHVSGYDFSKCSTDKELVEGLFKYLSPRHSNTLINMLSNKYYDNIANPPMWEKDENVNGNYRLVNDDDDKFVSLFNLIYATRAGDKKKTTPGSCQEEILTTLFKNKTKGNIIYEFLMATSSNDIVPMCKNVLYEIDDTTKTTNEMRLTWFVKEPNGTDYNPNFPVSMYSKVLKRGGISDPIDGKQFMSMIGYGDTDEQATYYKGFIWVSNRLDLVKYDKHQVHSSWIVTDTILTKTENVRIKLQVDDEYFNDESGDEQATSTSNMISQPMQTFQSAEELAAAFADDD